MARRLIRKYANRRLYDMSHSRYINLDDIENMIRDGDQVEVHEATTTKDITTEIKVMVLLKMCQQGRIPSDWFSHPHMIDDLVLRSPPF